MFIKSALVHRYSSLEIGATMHSKIKYVCNILVQYREEWINLIKDLLFAYFRENRSCIPDRPLGMYPSAHLGDGQISDEDG